MEVKSTVLVVDGTEARRRRTAETLRAAGFVVEEATTGREAVERAGARPDVILVEEGLPDLDPAELSRLLKTDVATAKIPLITPTPGSGHALLATVWEVAEMREAETSRRALNERFRALSRCAPVGIFMTDADGATTYTNPRCEEICGFSYEESLGDGWASFLHPADRQAVLDAWARCTREGREYVHEHRFVSSTGQVRWVRTRGAPMFSDDGKLLGYVGAVEDVGEQRQVEALRTEAEARRRVAQALVEVGHVVSRSASPDEVAERIANSARGLLGVESAAIYRQDPTSGDLAPVGYAGGGIGRHVVFPRGVGAVGLAAREKAPVATSDAFSDARIHLPEDFRTRLSRTPYRAVLAVPLLVQERVLGAFSALGDIGRVFDAEEIEVARAFADFAAVVLENARLYEEAEHRRRVAEALAEVGRLITRSLDFDEVSQRIVESARALLRARAATAYLLDPDSGDLVSLAHSGDIDSVFDRNTVFPKGMGAVGLAVREGKRVIIRDVLEAPRVVLTPALRARIEHSSLRSVLASPLIVEGGVIGALAVADQRGRIFDEDDAKLVQAFADQAAIAIRNSQSFARERAARAAAEAAEAAAERRRREAESLAELGRLISQSLDPAEVAQRIADSMRSLVGSHTAAVYTLASPSWDLVLLARSGVEPSFRTHVLIPEGTGLSGLACRSGARVVTLDILADPRLTLTPEIRDRLLATEFRSMVGVPLLVKDRPIGVLVIRDRAGRAFTGHEIALVQAFAAQAAIALENSRLYEEAEQRLRHTEVFLVERQRLERRQAAFTEIVKELAAEDDFDRLFALIGKRACGLADADTAIIALVEGDEIIVRGSYGTPALELITRRRKIAESRVKRVLGGKCPFVTGDMEADLLWRDSVLVRNLGFRALVEIPVMVRGEAIGVLATLFKTPRRIHEEDVALLVSFAEHTALALDRTNLLKKLEAQLAETHALLARLRVLRELDQAIVMARSAEDIAAVALRHLHRLVPCERASAIMFDADAQEATLLLVRGSPAPATEQALPGVKIFGNVEDLKHEFLNLADLRSGTRALGEGGRPRITVPLVTDGEPIGVLNLLGESPGAFTREHVDIVREVAGPVAIAIRQAHLHESVNAARARLESLSRQLVEVQEAERRHLARELHDEVSQLLAGLKLAIGTAGRAADASFRARLAEASRLVGELIAKVREISLGLRPSMLDDLGLVPALLWHFERYTDQTKVHVSFQHSGIEGQRFPTRIETAVYRIVQEALTNVARHAHTLEVIVRLWTDAKSLSAQIEDRGVGLGHRRRRRRGAGLAGMSERAALLGGTFNVESPVAGGVRITAELPVVDPSVPLESP